MCLFSDKNGVLFCILFYLVYLCRNDDEKVIRTDSWIIKINNDNETDELYSRYWHLIHDNFDLELLKKTERRAGHGSFMEPEYIDTLIEVIKEQPKKICTYRGYELIRGIDCWGNISYAPYKNGRQYGDVFDGYDDESAVAAFIKAIDDDPGDPDFML